MPSFDLALSGTMGADRHATLLARLNASSESELEPAIGSEAARAIVRRREEAGDLVALRELLDIEGVDAEPTLRALLGDDSRALRALDIAAVELDEELVRRGRFTRSELARGLAFVNTASETDLVAVAGVGEGIAREIVAERRVEPIRRLVDLERVPGVGPGRSAALIEAATNRPDNDSSGTLDVFEPATRRLLDRVNSGEMLPELGPTRGAALAVGRRTLGGFASVGELLRVPGFGLSTLAEMLEESSPGAGARLRESVEGLEEEEVATVVEMPANIRAATLRALNLAPDAATLARSVPGLGTDTASAVLDTREALGGRFPDLFSALRAPGLGGARLAAIGATAPHTDRPELLTLTWVREIIESGGSPQDRAERVFALVPRVADLRSVQYIAAALALLDAGPLIAELLPLVEPGTLGTVPGLWAPVEGSFALGSPDSDPDARADERPQRDTFVGPGELFTTSVTEAMWHVLMGPRSDESVELIVPVTVVTHEQATEFAHRLAALQGKPVRLPTEAEWEFGCRAETTSRWFTGDDAAAIEPVAWVATTGRPRPVALKAPNQLGCFDTHGNVWEWTQSSYAPYDSGATDGRMVLRGGSILDAIERSRSAARLAAAPSARSPLWGFRLFRTPEPSPPPGGGGEPPPREPPPEGGGDELEDWFPELGQPLSELPPVLEEPPRPVTQPGMFRDEPVPTLFDPFGPVRPSELVDWFPPMRPPDCPPCPQCNPLAGGDLSPQDERAIEEIERAAEQAKKDEDGDERDEVEDAQEQAQDDQDAADEEEERREDDPPRRRRIEAERQQEEEAERLEAEREAQRAAREELENDQADNAQDERELREREQELRDRGDPNCQRPECRDIRRQREENAAERRDLQQRQRDVESAERQTSRDTREWQQRQDQLDDAMDRGWGQTRGEHRMRRIRQEMQRLGAERDAIRDQIDGLEDRRDRQGGLSNNDERLLEHLNDQANALDQAIDGGIDAARQQAADIQAQLGAEEQASNQRRAEMGRLDAEIRELENMDRSPQQDERLSHVRDQREDLRQQQEDGQQREGELHEQLSDVHDGYRDSLAGRLDEAMVRETTPAGELDDEVRRGRKPLRDVMTPEQIRDARREMAIRGLGSEELDQFRADLDRVLGADGQSGLLREVHEGVGRPGHPADLLDASERDAARGRLDAAESRLEELRDRRAVLDERIEGAENLLDDRRQELDRVRGELRGLGHNEHSTPTGPDADRVAELQDQARALTDDANRLSRAIRGDRSERRSIGSQLPGARRDALTAKPLGSAARLQLDMEDRNARLAGDFDAQGNMVPGALRDDAIDAWMGWVRHENLRIREARLRAAAESGEAPAGTLRRLQATRSELAQVRGNLPESVEVDDEGRARPAMDTYVGAGLRSALRQAVDDAEQRQRQTEREQAEREARQQEGNTRRGRTGQQAAAQPAADADPTVVRGASEGAALGDAAAEHARDLREQADAEQDASQPDTATVARRLVAGLPRPALEAFRTAGSIIGGPVMAGLMAAVLAGRSGVRTAEDEAIDDTVARIATAATSAAGPIGSLIAVNLRIAMNVAIATARAAEDDATRQREAREQHLSDLRDLRDEYEIERRRAASRSDWTRVAQLDALLLSTEAQIRAAEGEDVDTESVLRQMEATLGVEVDIAEAASDELATEILRGTLVQAQSSLLHGLLVAAQHAGDSPRAAELALDIRPVGNALGDSLGQLAEAAERAAEAAEDDEAREQAEERATKARLSAANAYIHGTNWQGALDMLDAANPTRDEDRDWMTALALQGFAGARAHENDSEDGVTRPGRATVDERIEAQDRFLRHVEELAGDDPELAARAKRERAQNAARRGDRDEATTLLRDAHELLPTSPSIANDLVGHLLAEADPSDAALREVADVLADLPEGEAQQQSDRATMARLMVVLDPTDVDRLMDTIDASSLSDARKDTWHLFFDLPMLVQDVQDGISPADLQTRIRELEDRLQTADLDVGAQELEVFEADLARLQQGIDSFADEKANFAADPGAYSTERALDLALWAMQFEDVDLAESALRRFGEGDQELGRLGLLAAYREWFATAAAQATELGDTAAAQRWERLMVVAAEVVNDLTDRRRDELESALRDIELDRPIDVESGREATEVRSHTIGQPFPSQVLVVGRHLHEQVLQTMGSSAGPTFANAALERATRTRAIYSELALIEQMRANALLAGLTKGERAALVRAQAAHWAEESEARGEGARRRARTTTTEDAGDRESMARAMAEMASASMAEDAWRHIALVERVDVFDDRSRGFGQANGIEQAITTELQALDGRSSGATDGLVNELDMLEHYSDTEATEVRWETKVVSLDYELHEFRLGRLISMAPTVHQDLQGMSPQHYRMHLWGRVLRSRETRAENVARTLRRWDREDGLDTFSEDIERWERRAAEFSTALADDPALNGFARMKPGDDAAAFLNGLATGLDRITEQQFAAYDEYFPEGLLDRGLIQMWNLYYIDEWDLRGTALDTGMSNEAVLERISALSDRVQDMKRALWAAARGDELTPEQREGLLRMGVIEEVPDASGTSTGYRVVVPDRIDLEPIDADAVNLPQRSAWDDVINVRNLLEAGAVVLTGGIASGLMAGRIGLLMARLGAGRLLTSLVTVGAESLVFTAANRAVGAATDAAWGEPPGGRPQTSFWTEWGHSFVMFGAFRLLSRAGSSISNATGLASNIRSLETASRWRRLISPSMNLAYGTEYLSQAALATGMDALLSGRAITPQAFVQNLIDFPLFNRISQGVGNRWGGVPRPSSRRGVADEAPILGDLPTNARRAAEWDARLEPLIDRFGETARLGDPIATEIDAIRAELEAIGIDLLPTQEGWGTSLGRTESGDLRIFYDSSTTRVDILNEAYKARELAARGFHHTASFTREMEAMIEVASYRSLERRLFEGESITGRFADGIGRSVQWQSRLNAIRAGRIPNTVLHRGGEGMVIFARRPVDVTALRQRIANEMGATFDTTRSADFDTLHTRAHELLDWHVRVLESRRRRLNEQFGRQKTETDPARLAEIEAEIARLERLEDDSLRHIVRLLDGKLRSSQLPPDFRADVLTERAEVMERDPTTDPAEMAAVAAEHAWQRDRLAELSRRAETETGAQRARTLQEIKELRQEMRETSTRLGEVGSDTIVGRRFPTAIEIFAGVGSGVTDRVYDVDGRIVVVEEKGGAGTLITKDMLGFRVQQGTIENLQRTAYEMGIRGQELLRSDSPVDRYNGQRLVDTSLRIFEGIGNGTLEFYIAHTPWTADHRPGSTTLYPVRLHFRRAPDIRTTIHRMTQRGDGSGPRRQLDVGTFRLTLQQQVEAVSGPHPTGTERQTLATIEAMAAAAARNGDDIAVFPEHAVVLRRTDGETSLAKLRADPHLTALREIARDRGIHIALGVDFPSRGVGANLGVIVTPTGDLHIVHPEARLRREASTVDIDGVAVGLTVCSDASCRPIPGADLTIVISRAAPEVEKAQASRSNTLVVNWQQTLGTPAREGMRPRHHPRREGPAEYGAVRNIWGGRP